MVTNILSVVYLSCYVSLKNSSAKCRNLQLEMIDLAPNTSTYIKNNIIFKIMTFKTLVIVGDWSH